MPKSKEKLPPTQRLVCRFIIPSSSTSSSSSQSSSIEIDANSICGDGDDGRRPKNVLIQQRLKTPKKEKKHLLYPDDYEFTIPAAEQIEEKKKIVEEEEINKRKEAEIKMEKEQEIKMKEEERMKMEEEIKMMNEKEEERMKKNLPHSNSNWDESEDHDDGRKFEDGTTMSVCSSKSEYGDDDDDDEIGLTIRSIADEDDLGLTLTDMGDDETVKLCDDDEDNLTTIGPEDFDDDAKTLAAASPTSTIPADDEDFPQQQQSNSPNIYWRPEEFEPIKMDLSDLNKKFDWGKYSIGVVVEQIRQPSTGKLICYKVSPFCTGDPLIPEMFLETEKILQLGEWVQFNRGDLFARNINPETFKSHAQMFRTMPVLLDVIMECEITVPKPRGIIQSKWARWQTKLERENSQSQARFIHRVYDDSKMITDEHLGQDWWAVVEYQRRVHWEERMGFWRIVNIRPQCYGKWDEQQEENNGDDQKPCSSRQMK